MEVSEVCSKRLQVIKMKHLEKSVLLKDIENQLKEKKVGVGFISGRVGVECSEVDRAGRVRGAAER